MKIINVKRSTAAYFNLIPTDLDIKTNRPEIVVPRQIAHYLCMNNKLGSLNQVGAAIGFKNHATVIHSCKTINNMMDTNYKHQGMLIAKVISELNEIIQLRGHRAFEFIQVLDLKRQKYISQKTLMVSI